LPATNPLHLNHDPSAGIKRPKINSIRAWTDAELKTLEDRWPLGTKQRTAYALMLYVGTARVDVHKLTWRALEADGIGYTRNKTGVGVDMGVHKELRRALDAAPGEHAIILPIE
jgi:hypothetical protein